MVKFSTSEEWTPNTYKGSREMCNVRSIEDKSPVGGPAHLRLNKSAGTQVRKKNSNEGGEGGKAISYLKMLVNLCFPSIHTILRDWSSRYVTPIRLVSRALDRIMGRILTEDDRGHQRTAEDRANKVALLRVTPDYACRATSSDTRESSW